MQQKMQHLFAHHAGRPPALAYGSNKGPHTKEILLGFACNETPCWLHSYTTDTLQPATAPLCLQGHSSPARSHILDATLLSRKKQMPARQHTVGGREGSTTGTCEGLRLFLKQPTLPPNRSSLPEHQQQRQQVAELEGSTQQRRNKHTTHRSRRSRKRVASLGTGTGLQDTPEMGQHSKNPNLSSCCELFGCGVLLACLAGIECLLTVQPPCRPAQTQVRLVCGAPGLPYL